MMSGKIVSIRESVVDVVFPEDNTPFLKEVLVVEETGTKLEVELLKENNIISCLVLGKTVGLSKI